MNKFIPFFIGLLFLSSCEKNNEIKLAKEQLETDIELIQNYLDDNNLEAQSTASGLHFIIDKEGTGEQVGLNQNVRVKYKSYLLDGTLLGETTGDSTIIANTSNVLAGLQQSLLLLREGGEGTFFLPSNLAYGSQSGTVVPANAVIVYEIELIEIITAARQLEVDREIIRNYLEENNLEADSLDSGIYYFFEEEGEGENPTINSTVTVKYKGSFLDGEVFDQTTGNATATFPLTGVIDGWKIGIPLFKKGGKGTLLIPSSLAYGPSGFQQIPPNAVLIFEIELVDFN